MFKRKPLTPAQIKQRSEAGKASAQARHRAETTPSVKQGSSGPPSKQAVGLFRQGQARPDSRAARSVWDTRATEAPVGAFNATAKVHFPKAYRSKTPLPGLSRQAKFAALKRARQSRGSELTITNPEALLEAHRHPEMLAILKHVETVLRGHQDGAIERGVARGLIPEGTHPAKAVRAYKHAALRALHKAGLIDYTTHMDDDAKAEYRPLVPFMRYAARRVFDQLNTGPLNGKWHPFRDEFGQLYRQKKHGKLTGHERMRMRPEDQFIKQWLDGEDAALAKAFTDNNAEEHEGENKNLSRRRDKLLPAKPQPSVKPGRRWTHYSLMSHPSTSGTKDNPLGPVEGTSHPSIPHMPGGGSLKQAVDQIIAQVSPIAGSTKLNPVTKLYEVQDRPDVQKPGAELNMTALRKDFGFLNYNEDPNRQLNRAMHPRMRRRLPRLRLNTQRHLKRLLNGGVTRQERWQLGIGLAKAAPIAAGLGLGRKLASAGVNAVRHNKLLAGGVVGGAVAAHELKQHPKLRQATEGAALGAGAVALAARGNLGLLRRGTRAIYRTGLKDALREHVRVAEGATPSPEHKAAAMHVFRAAKKHALATAIAERKQAFQHLKRATPRAMGAAAAAGAIGGAASPHYTAAPLYQLAATPAGEQPSP